MTNKILFVPDSLMSAAEFSFISKNLNEDEFSVLIFDSCFKEKFEMYNKNRSIEYIYAYSDAAETKIIVNSKATIQRQKKGHGLALKAMLPRWILIPFRVADFWRKYLRVKKVLNDRNYPVCVIASDRSYVNGFNFPALRYFKSSGSLIVIPPYSIFQQGEGMLKTRQEKRFEAGGLARLFFKKYSLQDSSNGKFYLYYPIDILVTLTIFSVLPKNPWLMGTNSGVNLCVTSEYEKAKLISLAYDPKNLIVTGSYKWDLKPKPRVDLKKLKVGLGVPQLYEHNMLDWESHIEIIENTVELLASLEITELYLCLHPKMKLENYAFLANKYDCAIESKKTDSAIVDYNLYVATFSSTILTAVNYGVPSIVIDFYDLKYKMFDEFKSIKVVDNYESLRLVLEEICFDEREYKKAKAECEIDALLLNSKPGEGSGALISLLRDGV